MKRVFSLLILVIMAFTFTLTCYASGASKLCKIVDEDDVAYLSDKTRLGTTYSEGGSDLWYPYFRMNDDWFEMSYDFEEMKKSDQLEAIQDFVACLNSWDIQAKSKQAIYTSVYNGLESDVVALLPDILDAATADMASAMSTYWKIKDGFQFALGCAVVIIVCLLIAATVIDLAYLMSPSLMNGLLETADATGKTKWFVSKDAMDIAKAHALNETGEPIYFSYFKRRWLTYLIMSAAILALLTGGIGRILDYLFTVLGQVFNIQ